MPNININVLINRYWNNWQVDSNIEQFSEKLNAYKKAIKNNIDSNESEENLKNKLSDFLKSTFYKDKDVNTKVRIDLAIMNRNDNNKVEVIFEQKSPVNKAEFPKHNDLNCKAVQELLLYYLREKIDNQNSGIKFLIATNGYEFYVFDAVDFRKLFYDNKKLIKEYNPWREKKVDDNTTQHFYDKIAKKYIEEVKDILPFVYFDIRNENEETLYKFFSPYTLLKRSHPNDSNTLNTEFYNELLYIMGLEEKKYKIVRIDAIRRDIGSLLENTIQKLVDQKHINRINRNSIIANNNQEDRKKIETLSFEIAIELLITWINRILFLKLLEAQLYKFNISEQDAEKFKFLTIRSDDNNNYNLRDFSYLDELFFSVLSQEFPFREVKTHNKFKHLPYLNSSLFEVSDIEKEIFTIGALTNREMKVYNRTVLKSYEIPESRKINTLEYLCKFLDAYDFSSVGEVNDESDTIINASVLGLVFEKINGYRDGAVFTPGYITMYMCRDAIRRVVVQKFNEYGEKNGLPIYDNYEQLRQRLNKITDLDEINRLKDEFNEIRICDPAVGSGHFLVSALNEMIVIKKELGLMGEDVRYNVGIRNDELLITDINGKAITYNKELPDSQALQKEIFNAKKNIIENSLFGVDINPNSVNICRLRLWIELLKHSYYDENGVFQAMPNIDINIKCGNSLISNFKLDTDYSRISGNDEELIGKYKILVKDYKNETNKFKKWDIDKEIKKILDTFNANVFDIDQQTIADKVNRAKDQLKEYEIENSLFGDKFMKPDKLKRIKQLKNIVKTYSKEVDTVKIPEYITQTLEWRFIFPEVINDDGEFEGFDLVIGNPPYVSTKAISEDIKNVLNQKYEFADDLYSHFLFKAIEIAKENAIVSMITSKSFWTTLTKTNLRNEIFRNEVISFFDSANPFPNQFVDTCITTLRKKEPNPDNEIEVLNGRIDFDNPKSYKVKQNVFAGAQSKLLFVPNEYNIAIHQKYYHSIDKLYSEWGEMISTSKRIADNHDALEQHRSELKPGDITLLGCLTEGGQGLATGDNGKYIAVRRNTDYADRIIRTRPEKLFAALNDDDKAKYKINSTADAVEFLSGKSEAEIVELFDEIKEKYGRRVFGKGYLYRIIDDSEIADVSKLTDDEKANGIAKNKAYYVPYDKGDREGNRWYAPTPYAIAWTKENVQFLTENSGKKGEGMPVVRNKDFYFRAGFCWSDVHTLYIKSRVKGMTIHDVLSMSLFSLTDKVPEYYIICMLNSKFISHYVNSFINNTQHLQINDARMIPIIVPTAEQLAAFKEQYDKAIAIKKGESNESLEKVEKKIDSLVFDLYGISENERKYLDEYSAQDAADAELDLPDDEDADEEDILDEEEE